MEKWPNFFIVGAPKAGTTSLYEYLKDIPGIYMSPVKEPKYFSKFKTAGFRKKKRYSEEEYLDLFNGAKDEKFLGEATPGYLIDPDSPFLIHDTVPNAKILITLRDPVERLFSGYLMHLRLGNFKKSFREEVEDTKKSRPRFLGQGLYYNNVKRYLNTFGSNHVKILIFEEWIKDPKNVVLEILQFLGINYNLEQLNEEARNTFSVSRGSAATSIMRSSKIIEFAHKFLSSSTRSNLKEKFLTNKSEKPKMEKEDRNFLIEYYKDDVKKLEDLLGRKLPWKNFTSIKDEKKKTE